MSKILNIKSEDASFVVHNHVRELFSLPVCFYKTVSNIQLTTSVIKNWCNDVDKISKFE